MRDAIFEPETDQSRGGQHDGVVLFLFELAQPRLDIAAQREQLQVGPRVLQLALPPQAGRADARALRQAR